MLSLTKYFLAAGVVMGISALNATAGDSRPCDPYKIARWVHILQFDRDEDHREDAAEDLGKYADPSVIPLLAHAAAYDCDKSVRKEAGKAIARIRSRFPVVCRPTFQYVQPAPAVQYVQPAPQPQYQPQPAPQAQPVPQPQFQPQPPAPQGEPMPLPQPEVLPQGSSSGASAAYANTVNGYRWDAQRRVWVKVQTTYTGR